MRSVPLLSTAWAALAASSVILGLPTEDLKSRQTLVSGVLQGPLLNGAIPGLPDLTPILSNNTFDYIVVGAGTGGMTLAARLSEDGSSVAVMEAGGDYELSLINNPFANTPGGDVVGVGSDPGDALQDAIDWGFETVPQRGANNRVIRYARGKTVGGSSVRNFMIYQRPTVQSMNVWQQLTGDVNWGFQQRLSDFKKSMTFTPPKHDLRQEIPAAQYDPSNFGSSSTIAPLQVSYPNTPQNFSKYAQLSGNELGTQTVRSFNGGSLLGVQYNAATINADDGTRSTSRKFLDEASKRSNFQIFYQMMAKKLLLVKNAKGNPQATGVAYSTLPGGLGTTGILYARKEVIVSSGAFHSPQLLMVSGIGPQAQLTAQSIPVVVQNENVGQNMQDHIFFGPAYKVDPNLHTFTDLAANPLYLADQFLNFTTNQLGPLTNHVADLLAWEKLPPAALATLGSAGAAKISSFPPDWPILEHFSAPGVVANFANLLAENAAAGADGSRFATILGALVAPLSRGSVTLASADTATLPVIDPAWLTDETDQKVAIYAFKRVRQYFAARAMSPILFSHNVTADEYVPGFATVNTDAEILNWIRDNLMTVWHASCTCAMKLQNQGGVLDSRLRVYGVDALRVVDASSFPILPPGHPQSTIYMLA